MEKCTFCVQRLTEAKSKARTEKRTVRDGEVLTACAQACPTSAIHFGNLADLPRRSPRMWKAQQVELVGLSAEKGRATEETERLGGQVEMLVLSAEKRTSKVEPSSWRESVRNCAAIGF